MNADNFTQYLEDPSRLYQASYQELKSLALQYPYCQNLHLLLFQKSYMEGAGDWEQNLEKAAIYSIDRKHLFFQAKKLSKKSEEAEAFLLGEEFLELKSLETLQMEERLIPENDSAGGEEERLTLDFVPNWQPTPAEEKPQPAEQQPDPEPETTEFPDDAAGPAPQEEEGPPAELPAEDEGAPEPASDEQPPPPTDEPEPVIHLFKADAALISDCASLLEAIEALPPIPNHPKTSSGSRKEEKGRKMPKPKKETPRVPLPNPELPILKQKRHSRPVFITSSPAEDTPEPPKPQPKQSFTSWVEQFQSPHVQGRLEELMESKKLEEYKKKRKLKKKSKTSKTRLPGVGRLAVRSITENKEILSETLAELLASQGETQRAIEMYQALMLVFPQKSDYFAEKIENLKSK